MQYGCYFYVLCKISVVSNVTHLPGIENLNASLHGRQYFDINSAIPREVKCEVNQDCCINTPYHGEKDTPYVVAICYNKKFNFFKQ